MMFHAQMKGSKKYDSLHLRESKLHLMSVQVRPQVKVDLTAVQKMVEDMTLTVLWIADFFLEPLRDTNSFVWILICLIFVKCFFFTILHCFYWETCRNQVFLLAPGPLLRWFFSNDIPAGASDKACSPQWSQRSPESCGGWTGSPHRKIQQTNQSWHWCTCIILMVCGTKYT